LTYFRDPGSLLEFLKKNRYANGTPRQGSHKSQLSYKNQNLVISMSGRRHLFLLASSHAAGCRKGYVIRSSGPGKRWRLEFESAGMKWIFGYGCALTMHSMAWWMSYSALPGDGYPDDSHALHSTAVMGICGWDAFFPFPLLNNQAFSSQVKLLVIDARGSHKLPIMKSWLWADRWRCEALLAWHAHPGQQMYLQTSCR
jgi:hypothetical protein